MDMRFFRKFLTFPLDNLNGKLIFDHFLPSFRVPDAAVDFFAFSFYPFALWGNYSGWSEIQEACEGEFPPYQGIFIVFGGDSRKTNEFFKKFERHQRKRTIFYTFHNL